MLLLLQALKHDVHVPQTCPLRQHRHKRLVSSNRGSSRLIPALKDEPTPPDMP